MALIEEEYQKLKFYYTLKEIRKIVFDNQISLTTLQLMVKRQQIPCMRVNGRIYIPQFWVKKKIEEAIGHSI